MVLESINEPYWRKGLATTLEGIAEFGIKKPFTGAGPFLIVWNITKACNLRCIHCYEDAHIKAPDELTNEEAKQLEGTLITKYGRKLDGGILDNIKINQWACHTGWTHSEEARRKISNGNKGKVRTEEHKANYRKPKTAEHAEKIRQANLGRPYDPVRAAKISATLKARNKAIREKLNG